MGQAWQWDKLDPNDKLIKVSCFKFITSRMVGRVLREGDLIL